MTKVKKKRKNITLGIAHILATFNNTIVTFTDTQGNVIGASSAGANGFSGAKKSTPHAAQETASKAAEKAQENGVKTISIEIKGPGSQREAAIRKLLQFFIVTALTDKSPLPHNGTQRPKRRRV